MTQKPWRPTYPGTDLARIEGADLSPLEELAWRRLRDFMWLEPSLSLPADPTYLRRKARLTPRQWASACGKVLAMFELVSVPVQPDDRKSTDDRQASDHLTALRLQDSYSLATYSRQLNDVKHAEWAANVRWKSLRDNKRSADRALQGALQLSNAPSNALEVEVYKDVERTKRPESSSAIAEGTGSSNTPRRGSADEGQVPVASDQGHKVKSQVVWNEYGETAVKGKPRESECPWHAREAARELRTNRALRERYLAEFNRNPEDPPPGWVNRTGKWEFIGRPATTAGAK